MDIIAEIQQCVIDGDAPLTRVLVERALAQGLTLAAILQTALISAMSEVGARFERQEFYVPEMLIAARAMKEGLAVLRPGLLEARIEPIGKVALGTVKGDLHDIGKNLVAMMLEGAGFEVVDLGVDVPPEKFVEVVSEKQVQIIGMSALLTTTMASMKATIEALHAAGIRNRVKVMIGGAPVTQDYANQIGADLYAPDASSAARRARTLIA